MSELTLESAIDLAGGPVTAENCPSVIPIDQFAEFVMTITSVGKHFDRILSRTKSTQSGAIALTMSPAFACKVRTVQGGFALLVPLGMPARMSILARLLLRYWGREKGVRIIRSVLDDVAGDADAVPPMLKPLFLEDFEPEKFWANLDDLDKAIDADPRTEPDVRELVHLSLVYLLSHEFTHVFHGHFDLLARSRLENLGLSDTDIRRGIETDADDGAAAISMIILMDDIDRALAAGQPVQLELGWLRLAYAVTMLFAITDAHRKFLGAYEEGAYNHPMVRCELFIEGATRSMDAADSALELWRTNSTAGWLRCVQALEDLNLDALGGTFGKLPQGIRPAPLHTLIYSAVTGGLTDQAVLDQCREARELMTRVRALLPLFQNSS